jgi:putative membrane protein insertion efficiency factor
MRYPALALLSVYRYALGPLLATLAGAIPGAPRCKYEPSCSRYAAEAIRELGILRGGLLALWRLVRCNPWSHGGVDRVADRRLFKGRHRPARRPA